MREIMALREASTDVKSSQLRRVLLVGCCAMLIAFEAIASALPEIVHDVDSAPISPLEIKRRFHEASFVCRAFLPLFGLTTLLNKLILVSHHVHALRPLQTDELRAMVDCTHPTALEVICRFNEILLRLDRNSSQLGVQQEMLLLPIAGIVASCLHHFRQRSVHVI